MMSREFHLEQRLRQAEAAVAAAHALCERAEAQMTALETALSGYRVHLAGLVLRLRERQRQDPRRPDGTLAPEAALRQSLEQRAIERAHRHDAQIVAALTEARGGDWRPRAQPDARGRLQ